MTALYLLVLQIVLALVPAMNTDELFEIADAITAAAAYAEPIDTREGPMAPDELAALLVSIGWFESRLMRHVRRTDGGHTCTRWQVRVGPQACAALEDNVYAAAQVAVEKIRESYRMCRHNKPAERLAVYASGRCDRGLQHARNRYALAVRLSKRARKEMVP